MNDKSKLQRIAAIIAEPEPVERWDGGTHNTLRVTVPGTTAPTGYNGIFPCLTITDAPDTCYRGTVLLCKADIDWLVAALTAVRQVAP